MVEALYARQDIIDHSKFSWRLAKANTHIFLRIPLLEVASYETYTCTAESCMDLCQKRTI